MPDYLKTRGTGKRLQIEWYFPSAFKPESIKTTDGRIWFYHTTNRGKDVWRHDSHEGPTFATLERKNMPRKPERGRDYGQPRQRMRGKQFEAGDRIRFKPDKSLGTVVRATAYSLTVRFDDGELSHVSPHEVIHSASVKTGFPKNPGQGRGFYFLGSATSKIAARKIEHKHPGSFIHEKGGRYYILKPKKIRSTKISSNPSSVPIYGRVLRIEAEKTWSHEYGGKPSKGSQKYFHDFSTKNAVIYGLPDGSLLIKAKKKS
jgi:hypothetical protein